MTNEDLLFKVEQLRNVLAARATGSSDYTHASAYKTLRQFLIADPIASPMLPRFAKISFTLDDFWRFIQPKFGTYKERLRFLQDEFTPLITMLELGSSSSPTGDSKERSHEITFASERPSDEPRGGEVPNYSVKIFFSHSSLDGKLGLAITDLLKAALRLHSDDIRFTSSSLHGLDPGVKVSEELRKEISTVPVFLALLTPNSVQSLYVLFELGARWFQGGLFIPLAAGQAQQLAKPPLSELHVSNCEDKNSLAAVIETVGRTLSIPPDRPGSYERQLQNVVKIARRQTAPVAVYDEIKSLQSTLHNQMIEETCLLKIVRSAVKIAQVKDWNGKSAKVLMTAVERAGYSEEADDAFWWLIVNGVFEYQQIDHFQVDDEDNWRKNAHLTTLAERGVFLLNSISRKTI